jgi:chromosomal replication initiation ATPase DnaA
VNPSLYQLALRAAELAGVSHSQVFSRRRTDAVCKIRYAVWRIGRAAGLSLNAMKGTFGRKDHGTVLNGLRRAEDLYQTDKCFRSFCDQLSTLNSQPSTNN